MKTALTRRPSPHLDRCELTYIERNRIHILRAESQHREFRKLLTKCNYRVITLDAVTNLPDSVFVEDTALVLPEIAVVFPMAEGSRSGESDLIEAELRPFRKTVRIEPPAKIEGGDILRVGKTIFAGISARTNATGAEALAEIVRKWDYEVVKVPVKDALHLKTACTALDDETLIINPSWVDPAAFKGLRCIEVGPEEPFAANTLSLNNQIVMCEGFVKTRGRIEKAGFSTTTADISEFLKAEAGLTCLCILIED